MGYTVHGVTENLAQLNDFHFSHEICLMLSPTTQEYFEDLMTSPI